MPSFTLNEPTLLQNILSISTAKQLRKDYVGELVKSINSDLEMALEENRDIFEHSLTQPGLANYLAEQYAEAGYDVKVVPPCTKRVGHWLTFNLNSLNP